MGLQTRQGLDKKEIMEEDRPTHEENGQQKGPGSAHLKRVPNQNRGHNGGLRRERGYRGIQRGSLNRSSSKTP